MRLKSERERERERELNKNGKMKSMHETSAKFKNKSAAIGPTDTRLVNQDLTAPLSGSFIIAFVRIFFTQKASKQWPGREARE
jgi:hypothetical protein